MSRGPRARTAGTTDKEGGRARGGVKRASEKNMLSRSQPPRARFHSLPYITNGRVLRVAYFSLSPRLLLLLLLLRRRLYTPLSLCPWARPRERRGVSGSHSDAFCENRLATRLLPCVNSPSRVACTPLSLRRPAVRRSLSLSLLPWTTFQKLARSMFFSRFF